MEQRQTPGSPKTKLCPLVGSGILYMDHPKDHSLFGLGLPGQNLRLSSINTSLKGPPVKAACVHDLAGPNKSTDIGPVGTFMVTKCDEHYREKRWFAPQCQQGSLHLELISSLKESVASLAALCEFRSKHTDLVVEKIWARLVFWGVPHLSCRWFCCLPLSLVNASAWVN